MPSIHGLQIATSLEDVCHPKRLALLIYDMQVGICQQVANGSAIIVALPAFRWPTVATYHRPLTGWALSRHGWRWRGNTSMIRLQ